MRSRPHRPATLAAIKLLHTVIWAFFVACILGIPLAGAHRQFQRAGILIFLVLIECVVIAFNKGRCPLTDVAARYTDERADNFDIYLPLWLARHNKTIFGTLFALSVVFVLGRLLSGR
jgi:hypothetical protein